MKDKVILVALQVILFVAIVAVIVTGQMYFEWVREMATAETLKALPTVTG